MIDDIDTTFKDEPKSKVSNQTVESGLKKLAINPVGEFITASPKRKRLDKKSEQIDEKDKKSESNKKR